MPQRLLILSVLWLMFVFPAIDFASAEDRQVIKPEIVVYRNARIHTVSGLVIENGALVVAGGRIVDVGPSDKVPSPAGANVIDVTGKVIIPGLVDSHSHLGVYSRPAVNANSDGNEVTDPITSIVRALDSLNPFDPGIRMANAGGVTTANIMPGSANVIGGQTIYVKLRGYSPEQMWFETPHVLGGLKMANGENPKKAYGGKGKAPSTRMKVAALQRAELVKAQEYLAKWDKYRQKLAEFEAKKADDKKPESKEDTASPPTPPERSLSLEPLAEVLQKKRTVHFHTHRADDILTVLRLRREFDFDLVIQHGTESYKVLDEIAKAGVPISLTIPDSPGGKAEVVGFIEECAAELTKAGIKVHVNTDDPVTESRFLLRTAAVTVRGGLSTDDALKAITLYPAQALKLDHRVGSLEKGKDADFVVLSGEPFSVYSRVLETYIDGKRVFALSDERDRSFQTGGYASLDKSRLPEFKPPMSAPPAAKSPVLPNNSKAATTDATEFIVLAGRLHTVAKPTIADGAVHVKDGKILFAGPRGDLQIPPGVPVLTAANVSPGLIDAATIVPLSGEYNIPADQDADEASDPNQADARVLDAFNPSEPLLRYLLEQGITVVHSIPGRANVIGGLSGVFRTHGRTADAMTVRFPQALVINLGEAPKTTYKERLPQTRMGTAALIRQAFADAANAKKKAEAAKEKDAPADRSLKRESFSLALDKKVQTLFAAQQADDILTGLRLSQEFGLDSAIALAAEGFLIREQLVAAKVPIFLHPTMQRSGGSLETYHSHLSNASALSDANILLAITSGAEGYVPKTRVARFEAAIAAVHGLGFEKALSSISLDAAKVLRIDDRFGSIEPGKVADLVLYDGDPFEYATHTTHVVVDGRLVYSRADRKPIPLAQRLFWSVIEMPCCLGW
ncbi:MAG: amidohydrolase family protein [Planctomycetia bacterium]|nr:amidohydrolase family protein [Planctomycetia bacterium]